MTDDGGFASLTKRMMGWGDEGSLATHIGHVQLSSRQSRVARKIASSYLTNQVIRVSVSLAVSLTIYLSSFTRQSKWRCRSGNGSVAACRLTLDILTRRGWDDKWMRFTLEVWLFFSSFSLFDFFFSVYFVIFFPRCQPTILSQRNSQVKLKYNHPSRSRHCSRFR